GEAGSASNADGDADATIKVDWDDFQKIRTGDMDATMAFMQGKLKVEGDMSVAMQLQSLMSKFN
ncbi:MAG: SCP2 sterol-binding domain-containing protein, partial [Pseudomonadota bacterium]